MLSTRIPQPLSHLFTHYVGLLCTRKVMESLLDRAERPLQHTPATPQLLCFSSSLDHSSLIKKSVEKLVPRDGCPGPLTPPRCPGLLTLIPELCVLGQPHYYCLACFLRQKVWERVLEPRTSGTTSVKKVFVSIHSCC